MSAGETVGVPVSVGVNVAVDVAEGELVGIGVIVEMAITVFPILQLARMKTDHTKNVNLSAMMTTSGIAEFLSSYLNLYASNSLLSRLTESVSFYKMSGL